MKKSIGEGERLLTGTWRPLNPSEVDTERPLSDTERLPKMEKSDTHSNAQPESESTLHKAPRPYVPPIPFPSRLKNVKKDKQNDGCLPSLPKQSDPGSFELNVTLDSGEEVSGIMDLGAAVNLMPHSIFEKMNVKNLKATDIRIELADGTLSHPLGIVEGMAIIVRGIRVLTDFVVLEKGRGARSANSHLLLLGGPFMATTQTRIDVASGTLSMVGKGGSVTFSVFGKSPSTSTSTSTSTSKSLIHKYSYVQIPDKLDDDNVVQDVKDDNKHEVPIVEEFLSDEEDAIIEKFLNNLKEVEEVKEACIVSMQQEEAIVDDFFANLQDEAHISEEPWLKVHDEEQLHKEFQISVGERGIKHEPILDSQSNLAEKLKVRLRNVDGFLGFKIVIRNPLFVAMGFG